MGGGDGNVVCTCVARQPSVAMGGNTPGQFLRVRRRGAVTRLCTPVGAGVILCDAALVDV